MKETQIALLCYIGVMLMLISSHIKVYKARNDEDSPIKFTLSQKLGLILGVPLTIFAIITFFQQFFD